MARIVGMFDMQANTRSQRHLLRSECIFFEPYRHFECSAIVHRVSQVANLYWKIPLIADGTLMCGNMCMGECVRSCSRTHLDASDAKRNRMSYHNDLANTAGSSGTSEMVVTRSHWRRFHCRYKLSIRCCNFPDFYKLALYLTCIIPYLIE